MYKKINSLWLASDNDELMLAEFQDEQVLFHTFTEQSEVENGQLGESLGGDKLDLIVVTESWLDYWLETGGAVFSEHLSANPLTVIVADNIDIETEEVCYMNGAREVIHGASNLVTISRLNDHLAHIKFSYQASVQLEEASQMALLAMTNASDLGNMIKFTEDAIISTGFEQLANAIKELVEPFCEFVLVEILSTDKTLYFGTDDIIDPDLKRILVESPKDQRIIHHNDLVILNAKRIALVLSGLPIDDQNKIGRILDSLATFVSLSERFVEMIEHLEIINKHERAQKLFLSVIGHELRTPLNAINGFTGLLAKRMDKDEKNKTGVELCQRIQLNSWKMSNLIEVSLDIERISDVEKVKNEISSVDIGSLFNQLSEQFKDYLDYQNIELVTENQVSHRLFVDELRTKRIFRTLLVNAINSTEIGFVKISASIESLDNDSMLHISVEDSGAGMSHDDIKQYVHNSSLIQAHKENNDSRTAIGYLYVNLVCQKYNGKFTIESDGKNGTKVEFVFPVKLAS